jgi:16S rRNA G966 N2-methylase RsmD
MSTKHTIRISQDVQKVLQDSQIQEDRVILPPTQLDRKLYTDTMKVLTEYGGKWSRKDGAILIKAGTKEKLLQALDTGEVKREKVIRQAFYTPDHIAQELCIFAKPPRANRLLEPSAGGGSLVQAARSLFSVETVTMFEIDATEAEALRHKSFTSKNDEVLCVDFLTQDAKSNYDLVLLNPPFQKGQALKHVKHALRFVAPGGVLAAIVPNNFTEEFPGWKVETQHIPAGAFSESGTEIATKMIRLSR